MLNHDFQEKFDALLEQSEFNTWEGDKGVSNLEDTVLFIGGLPFY